jgi:hypothetical protein
MHPARAQPIRLKPYNAAVREIMSKTRPALNASVAPAGTARNRLRANGPQRP